MTNIVLLDTDVASFIFKKDTRAHHRGIILRGGVGMSPPSSSKKTPGQVNGEL